VEIFVQLLDEGVDVWRPVQAQHLESNVFRIIDQPYERETEKWRFEPGDEVICEMIDLSDNQILAATGLRADIQ
jgi:hypothetical protein